MSDHVTTCPHCPRWKVLMHDGIFWLWVATFCLSVYASDDTLKKLCSEPSGKAPKAAPFKEPGAQRGVVGTFTGVNEQPREQSEYRANAEAHDAKVEPLIPSLRTPESHEGQSGDNRQHDQRENPHGISVAFAEQESIQSVLAGLRGGRGPGFVRLR